MADVDNERPPGWVETPQEPKSDDLSQARRKVYGIDCEMVQHSVRGRISHILTLSLIQCTTEDGQELTRVCMIDYDTQLVVYDRLVKPAKPVIDYLTR